MAAIGVALWKYVMRYAPHTPDYFNRDRFVLSNGESTYGMFCAPWEGTHYVARPCLSLSVCLSAPHGIQGNVL